MGIRRQVERAITVLLEENQLALGRRVDAFGRPRERLAAESFSAVGFENPRLSFLYNDTRP
jgi:hypothetical protein